MSLENRILQLAQSMAATCKGQQQAIAALQQRLSSAEARLTTAEQNLAALSTSQAAAVMSMVEALKLTSDNNRMILKLFGI